MADDSIKLAKEYAEFMQPPLPMNPEDVPLTQIPHDIPPPSPNRRVLIAGVALLLIGGGALLGFMLWPEEATEPFPLTGVWMQGNGEVYTIEADGSGSNPSCMPKWTIQGNETTHAEDCTHLAPDGEPLWSEKIYSFEFVGNVLFMKYLSVENQDGYNDAPSDVLCTAWVLEDVAPDAETWGTIVNETAIPDMCSGIAGMTD
jgi:hypothetical protein